MTSPQRSFEPLSNSEDSPGSPEQSAVQAAGASSFGSEGRFRQGQVIAGRFAVVRFIARGGMGEVYEVADRFLHDVHVALKVILPEISADGNSSRRFEEEVIRARMVTHPSLCPIYDIARSYDPPPPFLFLTMKLLVGETLSARIKRQQNIPRGDALEIFRQLTSAIAAMHAANLLHRDIKPNNVMLDASGPRLCVSLMDFGLAFLHDPDATLGTSSLMAGTPGYMAPEILRRQRPSKEADVFSLGVLLHQVLTRRFPHERALSGTVEPDASLDHADVPLIYIRTVKEFLSNDPARRYAAFDAICQTFGNDSSGPRPAFGMEREPRFRISRRQFALGGAAAASLATVGAVWQREALYNLVHPLPKDRFVAMVGFPATSAEPVKIAVSAVIDAVCNELARAEASDRRFVIIPATGGRNVASADKLKELRDSVSANLVLAASGSFTGPVFDLALELMDPEKSQVLRKRIVSIRPEDQFRLPQIAADAAAGMLDLSHYKPDAERSKVGTSNPQAYAAFQAAEAVRRQENDAGVEASIPKYLEAIELDPNYAQAQCQLGWAYIRQYGINRHPESLDAANSYLKRAIVLDPGLAEAHLGLAHFYQQTGDEAGRNREIKTAISLDATSPHVLTYQANFFAADNQYDQAFEIFERIFSLRPNYWLFWNEWGAVLAEDGRYEEALKRFLAGSLRAHGTNALLIKNVGTAHLRLGHIPEAMEALTQSCNLQAGDRCDVSMAMALRIQQKYADAITSGRRAVSPGENPREPGHWLELGDDYEAAGKHAADADDAYRHAIATQLDKLKTSPRSGPGWMLLALCRAKINQIEEALELIPKAESMHAGDMDSQLAKLRIYELAKHRAEALNSVDALLTRSRGQVASQLQNLPDLESLRATSEFRSMVDSATKKYSSQA